MKYYIRVSFLVFILSLLFILPLKAQIYVNAAAGNDANAGTDISPYRTIEMALSNISAVSPIIYCTGTFYSTARSIMVENKVATAGNPYIIRDWPGFPRPIIDRGYTANRMAFDLRGSQHIIFDNLILTNTYRPFQAIGTASSDLTFINCDMIRFNYAMNITAFSGSLTISNCYVSDQQHTTQNGLYCNQALTGFNLIDTYWNANRIGFTTGVQNITLRNNYLWGSKQTTTYFVNFSTVTGFTCESNYIHGNGINCDNAMVNALVRDNIFVTNINNNYRSFRSGSCTDLVFDNNYICANGVQFIQTVNNLTMRSNTITGNQNGSYDAVNCTQPVNGFIFCNNFIQHSTFAFTGTVQNAVIHSNILINNLRDDHFFDITPGTSFLAGNQEIIGNIIDQDFSTRAAMRIWGNASYTIRNNLITGHARWGLQLGTAGTVNIRNNIILGSWSASSIGISGQTITANIGYNLIEGFVSRVGGTGITESFQVSGTPLFLSSADADWKGPDYYRPEILFNPVIDAGDPVDDGLPVVYGLHIDLGPFEALSFPVIMETATVQNEIIRSNNLYFGFASNYNETLDPVNIYYRIDNGAWTYLGQGPSFNLNLDVSSRSGPITVDFLAVNNADISNVYRQVNYVDNTPVTIPGKPTLLSPQNNSNIFSNDFTATWLPPAVPDPEGIASYELLINGTIYPVNSGNDVRSGLVGYWPMDDGSGTTIADLSVYGNTGTLLNPQGTEWNTAGMIGGAVNFGDGINNDIQHTYIFVPDSQSLSPSAMTFAGWINCRVSDAWDAVIEKHDAATGDESVAWGIQQGVAPPQLILYENRPNNGDPANSINSGISLTPGWKHIAVTTDGSSVSFYLNGSLVTSTACVRGIGTNGDIYIGMSPCGNAGAPDNDDWPNSAFDDIRLYGRVLSPAEVAIVYNYDGSPLSSTPLYFLTNIPDGTHQWMVRAVDGTGVKGEWSDPFTIIIGAGDPPTIQETNTSPNQVINGTYTFAGISTNTMANIRSNYFKGDTLPSVFMGAGDSWTYAFDTTFLSDGTHTVHFYTTNPAGRNDTYDLPVIIDNTPPVLAITSPTNGQEINGTYLLSGTASDAISTITSLTLYLSNTATSMLLSYPVSGASWSHSWNSASYDGNWAAWLWGTDSLGNSDVSSIVFFMADNGLLYMAQTNTHPAWVSGTISLAGYATNSNPTYVGAEVSWFGSGVVSTVITSNTSWQVNFDTTLIPDGAAGWVFSGVSGNGASDLVPYNLNIDNTPPTNALTSTQPLAEGGEVYQQVDVWVNISEVSPITSAYIIVSNTGGLANIINLNATSGIQHFIFDTDDYNTGAHSMTVVSVNAVGLTNRITYPFTIIKLEFNPLPAPNPSDLGYIYIDGLTWRSTVTAYTATGKFVRRWFNMPEAFSSPGAGNGRLRWDLTNDAGQKVGPGIYILLVQRDGEVEEDPVVLKVSIIREK